MYISFECVYVDNVLFKFSETNTLKFLKKTISLKNLKLKTEKKQAHLCTVCKEK